MASPFSRPCDELLLRGLKRRDQAAQAEIYSAFRSAVYTLCLRVLGDKQAALDALQDSFIDAFTHAEGCRDAARFGFWLRTITLNRCLKALRSRQPGEDFSAFCEELSPQMHSHATVALQHAIDLERALESLKPRARAVLWMYFVEGYQHHEIAELFGLSTSFSKSQLARASELVREFLEVPLCPTNP
jgi:RNA polymerase sigma factor (sigma-70 family)